MRRNFTTDYFLRIELLIGKSKDGKKKLFVVQMSLLFAFILCAGFRSAESQKSRPFYFRVVTIFRDVFLHFLRLIRKQRKSISSDFHIQRQ